MSSFRTSQSDDVVTIALQGEFDVANVDVLREAARNVLDADGITQVVVDLAEVTFMGSTALGFLVGLRADALRASIGMALSNVPRRVQRLLDLTGLDTAFAAAVVVEPSTGDR